MGLKLNFYDLPIKNQNTKTLGIKPNGRSSDFVTPNFIMGCNSSCKFCYVRRFGRKFIYVNQNTEQILNEVKKHSESLPIKVPNQCDDTYWTYDIGCDVDLLYHWKDYDWIKVLDFFNHTPNIKATFATKFTHKILKEYKVIDSKVRVRFSIVPPFIQDIVQPNTPHYKTLLKWARIAQDSGWDVHINLSPIILYKGWIEAYDQILGEIKSEFPEMKFEVIFLTHNENLHKINLESGYERAEQFMWLPNLQEEKISEYGGKNVRYKNKYNYVNQFKEVFQKHYSLENIRYIF